MKVCPFCKEQIQDEAIKCRYCASSLLPAQQAPADRSVAVSPASPANAGSAPAPGADQVVYVVDQGLISFVKFVGALLAIFATIGVVLWGFNIEKTADRVREDEDKVRESNDKVRDSYDKVRDAQDKFTDSYAKVLDASKLITTTKEAVEAAGKNVSSNQKSVQSLVTVAQAKNQDFQKTVRAVESNVGEQQRMAQKQITSAENKINAQEAEIKKEVEASRKNADKGQHELDLMLATAAGTVGKIQQLWGVLSRGGPGSGQPSVTPSGTSSTSSGYSVLQLAQLYDFPADLKGKGQTIGLIELGGGYTDADLTAYFTGLGLPTPQVTPVSVDGGKNSPGGGMNGPDAQVTLDIEVAGAVAPAAHIVVYFAPNTDRGFLDAMKAAVIDTTNRPSVLAIAWGGPESNFTAPFMNAMNQALRGAASRAITVVVAAGDSGVTDGGQDGHAHVDFPASSPWVLAVGGTSLVAAGGRIGTETVWNSDGGATGGGVSTVFPRPEWQAGVKIPVRDDGKLVRGIPDVVADAAPNVGYQVVVHGQANVLGGTSAAAPLWAGLIARIDEGVGHNIGYINPVLYTRIGPAGILHNITQGNNSIGGVAGYSAGPGWSAVAGWGSPDGRKLLDAFRQ